MRIARYTTGDDPTYGVVEGEPAAARSSTPCRATPSTSRQSSPATRRPLDDVRLLAPVIPRSKVIGIGKNYADHAAEMGGEAARPSR